MIDEIVKEDDDALLLDWMSKLTWLISKAT